MEVKFNVSETAAAAAYTKEKRNCDRTKDKKKFI